MKNSETITLPPLRAKHLCPDVQIGVIACGHILARKAVFNAPGGLSTDFHVGGVRLAPPLVHRPKWKTPDPAIACSQQPNSRTTQYP
jgi:hypothetical protein